MRTVNVSEGDGYGWIANIPAKPCMSSQGLRDFYKRAGVLVACADALNYSDGHFENLIASGQYPVLLDGETFFQNYAIVGGQSHRQDILSTHLVLDRDPKKELSYGALQAAYTKVTEKLIPHPINDGTDELQVRLVGTVPSNAQNAPVYQGKRYTASQFLPDLVEGFSHGYDRIMTRVAAILDDKEWWNQLSRCPSRTVLRDTGAYVYLLRRVQQPEFAANHIQASEWLYDTLKESPYKEYEVSDILNFNIPYFYHYPAGKDLYDGRDGCYKGVFRANAVEQIRSSLMTRTPKHKADCVQLLEKHLAHPPYEVA